MPLSGRAREWGLVAVGLAVAAIPRLPALRLPLLDTDAGFRQAQTALTARVFHEQGISLLHYQTPVLGAPWTIPFEFPLFQAAAALLIDAGVAPDTAVRTTALVCFLGTAALLYGLVRHVAGRIAAAVAFVAFVSSPFSIVWSRAALIEFLATAGAIGWLWAGIVWRDRRGGLLWAAAVAAGCVAMIVKVSTGVFIVLPLLAYRSRSGRRLDPWLAGLIALPILAGAWWTRYADRLNAGTPAGPAVRAGNHFLNWGAPDVRKPVTIRLHSSFYATMLDRLWLLAGLGLVLLAVSLVGIRRTRQPRFWGAVALAGVTEVLVFANLHFIHDYYQAAVAPLVSALVGVGGCLVWQRVRTLPHAAPAAVLAAAVAIAVPLAATRGYWLPTYDSLDPAQSVQLVASIDAHSRPDQLVAVMSPSLGWNPQVFYYAHRRGQMMPVYVITDALPVRLRRQGYTHFFSADPATDPLWTMGAWRWVGAVDAGVYRTATERSGLGPVVAAAGAGALPPGRSLIVHPRTLRCGRTLSLSPGRGEAWLQFAPAPRDARLLVSPSPLPVRRVVVLRGSRLTIGCEGVSAVRVLAAHDVVAQH